MNTTVTSKARTGSTLQQILGIIAFILLGALCFHFAIDKRGQIDFRNGILYLSFVGFIAAIAFIVKMAIGAGVQQIRVSEEGIFIRFANSKKDYVIHYDQVKNYKAIFTTSRDTGRRYYKVILELTDDEFVISEEDFENYDELKHAIFGYWKASRGYHEANERTFVPS